MKDSVSPDQTNFDVAGLLIDAANLPHVKMGSLKTASVGDAITILARHPAIDGAEVMLKGTVAAKTRLKTLLGPKPIDTIIFQCPVRNGFSGAPIFDSDGNVIGIVTTKVFGISQSLDSARQTLSRFPGGVNSLSIGGVSYAGSMIDLINNLDQNLISGLGSGVAIDYAKQ